MSALFAFSFAAFAGTMTIEQDFPDQNCGITFPEGWHAMANIPSRPDNVASYIDSTRRRIVNLIIENRKLSGPLDDHFVAEFNRDFEKDGETLLSGKYIEVGGIKSYERVSSFVIRGKQMSSIDRLIPGEDRYYIVQGLVIDGDVNADYEIQQSIASFRFLHPFVPSYSPNSIAYRIGQLVRYLMITLAVVAVVVFAVRSSRKPPRPNSPQPPPLPPGIRLR
ncbi:MAG TPA: hypothetical protein VH280_03200 [Verrucomicrobiae bacterium]|nr:hypothetical protein [Verrucomicrobiae bacterium]